MLPGMTNGTDVLSLSRWQDWYAEVESAFDELAATCDTVFVGGLSAGSILAVRLACRRQDRIAGVLALAPTLWPNGWAIPRAFNLFRLVTTRWFSRLFRFEQRAPYGIKDERLRKMMMEAYSADNRSLGQVYARSGVTVLEFLRLVGAVKREAGQMRLPMFVAHPREDDQSHLDNALHLQRMVAGPVDSIILDDSYHVITVDRQRDIVVERSLEFIQRVEKRAALQRQPAAVAEAIADRNERGAGVSEV
jgi:carboxylesterase